MAVPAGAGRLLDHDEDSAVIASLLSPDTLLFMGTNFQYADDRLTGGIVTEIVYQTSTADYFRMTDIRYDVSSGVPFFGGADPFAGNDLILGSLGRDLLRGQEGDDRISGGKGQDYIIGGQGDDTLQGGGQRDTFVFVSGDGIDRIVDFDARGRNKDVLTLGNFDDIQKFEQVDLKERHGNVIIEMGSEQRITLINVDLDELSPSNFHFIE